MIDVLEPRLCADSLCFIESSQCAIVPCKAFVHEVGAFAKATLFIDRNPKPCSLSIPSITLSVLPSIGGWLPQLRGVVANEILSTSKRKGWCCHGPSLSSFIPSLFAIRPLFQRSEFDSLWLSLPHNLSDAYKTDFDQKSPFWSKSLSDRCFSYPGVMSF